MKLHTRTRRHNPSKGNGESKWHVGKLTPRASSFYERMGRHHRGPGSLEAEKLKRHHPLCQSFTLWLWPERLCLALCFRKLAGGKSTTHLLSTPWYIYRRKHSTLNVTENERSRKKAVRGGNPRSSAQCVSWRPLQKASPGRCRPPGRPWRWGTALVGVGYLHWIQTLLSTYITWSKTHNLSTDLCRVESDSYLTMLTAAFPPCTP